MTSSTVLVCAHNEEDYIGDCLESILRQKRSAGLIIVVADRCTDRTVDLAKKQLEKSPSLILQKHRLNWRNSISENLQLGFSRAIGDALVIVDADMTLPPDFLAIVLPQMDRFAVVSAIAKTDSSRSVLNRLVSVWELTYTFSPLGEQPRGGARAISMRALKAVGGFRDVYAWETDLDLRLRRAGLKVKLDKGVVVLHRRRMTLARSIAYQIQAGRARRELGISPVRTLLHSIIRMRPFVLIGYLTR